MNTNVLSLPKTDAVESPSRSLREVVPEVHKKQLLGMGKLVITMVPSFETNAMKLQLEQSRRQEDAPAACE